MLENNIKTKTFGEFIKDLFNRDNVTFDDLVNYLKSGPDKRFDFSRKLTEELFFSTFFVDTDAQREKRQNIYEQFIKSLFYNIAILNGTGGSGKSVFIKKLRKEFISKSVTTIVIDFGENETELENIFVKTYKTLMRKREDIRTKYIKEVCALIHDTNYTLTIKNNVTALLETLIPIIDIKFNRLTEDTYIGNGLNTFDKLKRKIVAELKEENSKYDENTLLLILIFIFRYIINKIDNKNSEPTVYIFDNIENLGRRVEQFVDAFKVAHEFLQQFLSSSPETFTVLNKFLIVSRKTTNLNILKNMRHGGEEMIKSFEIEFYDFSLIALLKKISYLDSLNISRKSIAYQILRTIAIVASNEDFVDSYLNQITINNDIQKKYNHFTTLRFLPFFGYSFRMMMEHLLIAVFDKYSHQLNKTALEQFKCFSEKLNIKRDSPYFEYNSEYQSKFFDFYLNGKRLTLFKDIFDHLFETNVFEVYGIYKTDSYEQLTHAKTLLNLLYWDWYCHQNKYYGMNLKEVESIISEINNAEKPVKGSDAIVKEIIRQLSSYRDDPNGHRKEKIGSLIELYSNDGLLLDVDDMRSLIESGEADRLRIKITDTGKLLVQYVFPQLEFLNSQMGNSCSLFETAVMTKDNECCFDTLLTDLFKEFKSNIVSSIKNGERICKLYNINSNKQNCRIFNHNDCYNCSLFARYQAAIRNINEAIYYIDRFRIFIISLQTDFENAKSINIILLKHIKKFAGVLNTMRNMIISPIEYRNNKNEYQKFLKFIHSTKITFLNEGDKYSCDPYVIKCVAKGADEELERMYKNEVSSIKDIVIDDMNHDIRQLYKIGLRKLKQNKKCANQL